MLDTNIASSSITIDWLVLLVNQCGWGSWVLGFWICIKLPLHWPLTELGFWVLGFGHEYSFLFNHHWLIGSFGQPMCMGVLGIGFLDMYKASSSLTTDWCEFGSWVLGFGHEYSSLFNDHWLIGRLGQPMWMGILGIGFWDMNISAKPPATDS